MRLLHLSTARIPGEKANTYQVLQMCDAFSAVGMKVTLLHPERVNIPQMRQIKDIKRYYKLHHHFSIEVLPALDMIYLSNRWLSPFPKLLRVLQVKLFKLLMTSYRSSLIRYLRNHSADIYYCRNVKIVRTITIKLPELAPKLFYEAHGFPEKSTELHKLGILLNQIAGLITTNNQKRNRFQHIGIPPERILVAPNGVDLKRFKHRVFDKREARNSLSLPYDRRIIGYTGRLETLGKEKGVTQIIEAIAVLKRDSPSSKVTLCCVGGPDEIRQKYQSYARQLGLSEVEAKFIEQVHPAEVPKYLSAFDICAMPFPWSQNYAYYMSPLKLFEYMASKRVILATKLPAVEEILKHKINAYLVQPNDTKDLANGIHWLISHQKEAQRMADQAWQDVQEYSWEIRAERIVDFMKSRTE